MFTNSYFDKDIMYSTQLSMIIVSPPLIVVPPMIRKNVILMGTSLAVAKSPQQVTAAFLLPSRMRVDPTRACQANCLLMLMVPPV